MTDRNGDEIRIHYGNHKGELNYALAYLAFRQRQGNCPTPSDYNISALSAKNIREYVRGES